MKKEFYKLSIVFTMIVFSFSLAFFLGREVTLSGLQKSQDSSAVKSRHKSPLPREADRQQGLSTPGKDWQRKKVRKHKKALIPDGVHKQAQEQAEEKSPPPSEEPPTRPRAKTADDLQTQKTERESAKNTPDRTHSQRENKKITALLISVHSNKESATEKSTQLKIRFPRWKIFFKESGNFYKVYIGPFRKKESAEKFLNQLKDKPDLSGAKLEEI